MVGLDVDEFLGKQDLILTEFNIVREPNRDFRDAFPSKCGQLYSPRPKKKSEARETRSRPVPRIDMHLMAGAVMQLRQHWPLLLEARSRYSGGRAVYVSGLEELYTHNPRARGGTIIGLAEQLDAEVTDAASLYKFVERLVDGKLFDPPPGWDDAAERTVIDYESFALEDQHRRASVINAQYDDDEDCCSESSLECLDESDDESGDSNAEEPSPPPRTPMPNPFRMGQELERRRSARREAASTRPPPLSTESRRVQPEALDRAGRDTLARAFADELYGGMLEKPTTEHYISLGWHHHPEVYAARFESVARDKKHSDLIQHVRDDLAASPMDVPSDGLVRRRIEQLIYKQSPGRNYSQMLWAQWFRAHHTPLCVRELLEKYGDSVLYIGMMKSLENAHFDRDARMINLVADYLQNPCALSLDNFQKGFATKTTSRRETSKFHMMTDVSAVWAEIKNVGSIQRPRGFSMTCERADLEGDAGDEELCKMFDVALEWLSEGSEGLAEQSYLTADGAAQHSGRFGISETSHFGVGAFPLHPDGTVDTAILLCMLVTLFSEVHCRGGLGPAAIPFAIVFTLDQKCYDNVRKAVATAATMGNHIFASLFPVPDHWHAVQAAGFAAILNGICWRFFTIYRKAVFRDKYKSGLTSDHFSRQMNFNVMHRHLNIIRQGWIRVRSDCLAHVEANPNPDPDLLAFVTWNDYIVPVVYDLLIAIKKSPPELYQKLLAHFVIVLYLLDRILYANAFDFFLRDLLRIKRTLPAFYAWFMANLNRVLVCLHIEYQHKELAPLTEHLSDRGAEVVDSLICSLPSLRDSNVHAASYKGLIKPRHNACSLSEALHDEHHVQCWSEEAKRVVWLLASANGATRSSTAGDTVTSPRFGAYPAKLTRQPEFHWAARWSKGPKEEGEEEK